MASFPTFIFQPDDIKIRHLEPFASEALDKRFLALPFGVSEGLEPVLADPIVSLTPGLRNFSQAAVKSLTTPVSLSLITTETITLDFTGHDFTASGDLYVVLKANYALGITTTAQLTTQAVPPIGTTEIAICRVTGTGTPGSGGTVDSVEFAAAPDRHTNRATADQPFGFMDGGSKEALDNLLLFGGAVDPVVLSGPSALPLSSVGRTYLLDMGAIGADAALSLPSAATLSDGASFGFLSLTGVPAAYEVTIVPDGLDEIVYQTVGGTKAFLRKHVGHFVQYTLVKNGLAQPTWFPRVHTLRDLHAVDHQDGGDDPIRLDDLAEPTDNTDLDATITRHGLLRKLSNIATEFLDGQGNWSVPGGAVSGGPIYTFNTPALSGNAHTLPGDGTVSILNPPGGSGLTTYTFPPGTDPIGSIVRVAFLQDGPAAPNDARFVSASGQFVWNGGLIAGTDTGPTAGLFSDWRRGQFLEFTLQNFTGGNLWVCTANQQLADHSSRHADGEQDELDVTTLAGFPGGVVDFLRADGSFASPLNEFFAARSSALGSPIDWNIVDVNEPSSRFTLFAGDTEIEVPSAGFYLIGSMGTGTGTGGAVDIRVGGVSILQGDGNAGVGGAWSATPVVGVSITTPATERITMENAGLTANAGIIVMKVR